jgi:hypothetical protein
MYAIKVIRIRPIIESVSLPVQGSIDRTGVQPGQTFFNYIYIYILINI